MLQMPLRGLTGEIRLNRGRRYGLKLDILQLSQKGLVKVRSPGHTIISLLIYPVVWLTVRAPL